MTRNISELPLDRSYRNNRLRSSFNPLRMAKTKSVVILCMIITACAVIFSLSDAYPTPGEELNSTVQSPQEGNVSESDGAGSPATPPKDPKLVITHVVKTLEFEVDEVDSDENSTETTENVTNFEETDIKLLDVNLLRTIVNNIPTGSSSTEQSIRSKKSAEESKESEEEGEATGKSTEKSSTKGGGENKNDS